MATKATRRRVRNGPVTLAMFLKTPVPDDQQLSIEDRMLLVEQAMLLLEQNYAHLPLKVAMHAVNPVQALRLLQNRLRRQQQLGAPLDSEWSFHAELAAIFNSVRDLHTVYIRPKRFKNKYAYLPFQVEEYYDPDPEHTRHYIVTRLERGYEGDKKRPADFCPGVEVTHWNGVPIERAVELQAARFAGSNEAGRHARGVEALWRRELRYVLPPDEEWVTVSYWGAGRRRKHLLVPWFVGTKPTMVSGLEAPDDEDEAAAPGEISDADMVLGLDLGGDDGAWARRQLFAPQAEAAGAALPAGEGSTTDWGTFFRAAEMVRDGEKFLHLRIHSFNIYKITTPEAFVQQFIRLVVPAQGVPPYDGLIIDVRGNTGGNIFAAECLLQVLTPRSIAPQLTQFINSPLNLQLCSLLFKDWHTSMVQAVETGATFSGAFPLTNVEKANEIGQLFFGPVVLITDARCYSATDIFAAGFQDHGIGPVLGVDANTGAGGANVWTHEYLRTKLQPAGKLNPYRRLPKGTGMSVALRRTLRGGNFAGTPVEDLGVTPDVRYWMTRADLLCGNVGLLDEAARLLREDREKGARCTLTVEETPRADGGLCLTVEAHGVDHAVVLVDGRARQAADIGEGQATLTLPAVPEGARVRVEGFAGDKLVAAWTRQVGRCAAAPVAPRAL